MTLNGERAPPCWRSISAAVLADRLGAQLAIVQRGGDEHAGGSRSAQAGEIVLALHPAGRIEAPLRSASLQIRKPRQIHPRAAAHPL